MKKLNYGDVMNHAIKVTSETVADVFVDFSGHVGKISIYMCGEGFPTDEEPVFFEFENPYIRTTEQEIHEHCEEIIAFIDANIGVSDD